jgi:hypothetical protein
MYIAKHLLTMSNPPVKLAKIALGDPALGSSNEFKIMPTVSMVRNVWSYVLIRSQLQTLVTHPAIIGYDVDVYNYFAEQSVSAAPISHLRSHNHTERIFAGSTSTLRIHRVGRFRP